MTAPREAPARAVQERYWLALVEHVSVLARAPWQTAPALDPAVTLWSPPAPCEACGTRVWSTSYADRPDLRRVLLHVEHVVMMGSQVYRVRFREHADRVCRARRETVVLATLNRQAG